jgi:hypothetical protein
MPQTLLAKKSGPQDNAIATDDEHHEQLATDPTVSAFPQGSAFGPPSTSFGGSPAFGAPAAGGFGGASSFGSPAPTPSFGSAPTGSFNGQQSAPMAPQPNLTEGAKAAVEGGAESTVALDKDATDWINKKWRPMMGWMYMATCTADFVVFPVLWSILQALSKGNVTSQWQPLTLQGAGLYHVAMGAVLGIAAYGRTKEKIEGASK